MSIPQARVYFVLNLGNNLQSGSENKINIEEVKGSGKDGRVLKGDLINLMGNIPQPSKRKITHGPEERVKMTREKAEDRQSEE